MASVSEAMLPEEAGFAVSASGDGEGVSDPRLIEQPDSRRAIKATETQARPLRREALKESCKTDLAIDAKHARAEPIRTPAHRKMQPANSYADLTARVSQSWLDEIRLSA